MRLPLAKRHDAGQARAETTSQVGIEQYGRKARIETEAQFTDLIGQGGETRVGESAAQI